MAELLLTIPDAWWLTSNGRYHPHARAKRVRAIRQYAAIQARNAGLRLPPQVHIWIMVGYPTRQLADPPNAWDSAKPAIDGIVDAGTLAEDNSEIVYAHSFARDPKKCERGTHTLRLVFTDQCLPF